MNNYNMNNNAALNAMQSTSQLTSQLGPNYIQRVPETAYDFNTFATCHLDEAIAFLSKHEELPLHLARVLDVMKNLQRKNNVDEMNRMAPEKLAKFMAAFEKSNGEIGPVEDAKSDASRIDALKQADNALQKAIAYFRDTTAKHHDPKNQY